MTGKESFSYTWVNPYQLVAQLVERSPSLQSVVGSISLPYLAEGRYKKGGQLRGPKELVAFRHSSQQTPAAPKTNHACADSPLRNTRTLSVS